MQNTTVTSFEADKRKRYIWVYVLSAVMLAVTFALLSGEIVFYNGLNAGVLVQHVGGFEWTGTIDFFGPNVN